MNNNHVWFVEMSNGKKREWILMGWRGTRREARTERRDAKRFNPRRRWRIAKFVREAPCKST